MELKNTVERSVYRSQPPDEPVMHIHFDPFDSPYRIDEKDTGTGRGPAAALPIDLRAWLADQERSLVVRALELNRYHQGKTARTLGLTYHQLRGCLRKYGIAARPRRGAAASTD
jgi:psp operon transcriptional activator